MRKIDRTTSTLLFLIAALSSPMAMAADSPEEGIVLVPGQWIFDVKIRMPMQTVPSSERLRTCVETDLLTASTLMPWVESQGCKIRRVKAKENKLTWKLRCRINGQKSRGSGEFTVDGDRGEGKSRVSFEMGGRRMSIVTTWDATRVGPCSTSASGDSVAPEEREATE